MNLSSSLAFVLLATALAMPPAGAVERPAGFKSVNIDLPFGDRAFPDGPGSDSINNNCLACHSAGMVLNQPTLPRATWEAEVNKMRTAYKTPIADKDVAAIVDYLTRIKGPR